jgi:hypothetical protein
MGEKWPKILPKVTTSTSLLGINRRLELEICEKETSGLDSALNSLLITVTKLLLNCMASVGYTVERLGHVG